MPFARLQMAFLFDGTNIKKQAYTKISSLKCDSIPVFYTFMAMSKFIMP
jgi:hypothetical protein